MIEFSFSEFVFVYLFAFLGVVAFAWGRHNVAAILRRNAALRHRVLCRLCSFEFEDGSKARLSRCPKCASPTERDSPPLL
jgi:hypothetical protein